MKGPIIMVWIALHHVQSDLLFFGMAYHVDAREEHQLHATSFDFPFLFILHPGPHSVEQVDRLGAGDAFDAGLLYGILQDDLESGLRFGAALAALSYSEQGDVTWSTLEEVGHLAGLVKT